MKGHRCRVCAAPEVPVFRFACGRCYRSMPLALRAASAHAWKFRMAEPNAYVEVLAAVLLWDRDRRANRIEYEGEKYE